MPVFLVQWRDGDFTLTAANSREEARAQLQVLACINDADIMELKADHLSVSITLDDQGRLLVSEYQPAIDEARRLCFPALVDALGELHPDVVRDPEQRRALAAIVNSEMKTRRISRLSRLLRK